MLKGKHLTPHFALSSHSATEGNRNVQGVVGKCKGLFFVRLLLLRWCGSMSRWAGPGIASG